MLLVVNAVGKVLVDQRQPFLDSAYYINRLNSSNFQDAAKLRTLPVYVLL